MHQGARVASTMFPTLVGQFVSLGRMWWNFTGHIVYNTPPHELYEKDLACAAEIDRLLGWKLMDIATREQVAAFRAWVQADPEIRDIPPGTPEYMNAVIRKAVREEAEGKMGSGKSA